MANSDKPYTEIDDPAKKPSLEELGSGAAERAVFGESGMGGMVRITIAVIIFIVACGTMFYLWNN